MLTILTGMCIVERHIRDLSIMNVMNREQRIEPDWMNCAIKFAVARNVAAKNPNTTATMSFMKQKRFEQAHEWNGCTTLIRVEIELLGENHMECCCSFDTHTRKSSFWVGWRCDGDGGGMYAIMLTGNQIPWHNDWFDSVEQQPGASWSKIKRMHDIVWHMMPWRESHSIANAHKQYIYYSQWIRFSNNNRYAY